MMPSLPEYERLVYSLPAQYPSIQTSTLVVKRTSASSAQISGTVYFDKNVSLRVLETIDFADSEILDYSYEVRRGAEKLYWYDCWPHPSDPSLAVTHPHHKHLPPDIKHHRVPAPNLTFNQPNLNLIIEEIEKLLTSLE
jgi:hypothetical protein